MPSSHRTAYQYQSYDREDGLISGWPGVRSATDTSAHRPFLVNLAPNTPTYGLPVICRLGRLWRVYTGVGQAFEPNLCCYLWAAERISAIKTPRCLWKSSFFCRPINLRHISRSDRRDPCGPGFSLKHSVKKAKYSPTHQNSFVFPTAACASVNVSIMERVAELSVISCAPSAIWECGSGVRVLGRPIGRAPVGERPNAGAVLQPFQRHLQELLSGINSFS